MQTTLENMTSDLEKRVENLEKIVRENFNNLGSKITKIDPHPDENNSNGGYIYLYCGGCSKNLGTCSISKLTGVNYCPQCGIKIELGKDFDEAVSKIQHAKEIYDKVSPLKREIETLSQKKKS